MKLCSRPENYGPIRNHLLARHIGRCRSSLIEQGQLEVAGAGPLAIAPALAVPPCNRPRPISRGDLFRARRMRLSGGRENSRMGLRARRLRQSGRFREPVEPQQPGSEVGIAPP